MKSKLFISVAMLMTALAFSQSSSINYKALIKDNLGNVVANDLIVVQFQILQGVGMTNVYQETHTPNTDANGFVILNIGEGSVNSGDYSTIDWGSDDHYLNVQINTGGGLTDMGTTQFMAVPYALNAANAASKIDDLSDGYSKFDIDSSLFLGELAGQNDNRQDNHNMGIGYGALNANITGSGNLAIGELALVNNNGDGNTAIGQYSLLNNSEGTFNTAIGVQALDSNLIGDENTATGAFTLDKNTSGSWNTATGFSALNNNIEGYSNVANGYYALYSNESGFYNTATGVNALRSNTSGIENTGIGHDALRLNTTGNDNTATGSSALASNTTGFFNVAIGSQALDSNTEGIANTATGYQALFNNSDGDSNTANGRSALQNNTTGNTNTAIGQGALYLNTTGSWNTAMGSRALYSNEEGLFNTAMGGITLNSNITGSWNTAIGYSALNSLTSGNNNIGIGNNAQPSSTTVSNEVTIGSSANNAYRMYTAGWLNASDRQLKHDIQSIPVGLDLVLKLRPVEFIYNNANNEQKTFGFIAQEVKEAVKQSNLEDNILVSPLNNQYLGLRTTEIISVLTKAIQEQQEIIEKQATEIRTLKEEQSNGYEKLLKRIEQLELVVQQ